MKKLLIVALIIALVFTVAACNNDENPVIGGQDEKQLSDTSGLVVVITSTFDQSEEEPRAGEMMMRKYPDRVIHELWPARFMDDPETMVKLVEKIAENPDVKALIIIQAVPGTNAAVDKFIEAQERRGRSKDDYLICYYEPQEDPPEVAARADLIVRADSVTMGYAMPKFANEAGAKTFIHYSFTRHTSQPAMATRMKILKEECEKLGIKYVELTAPDPVGDAGLSIAQQFILEDVPKQVEQYGKDTAFFTTNCGLNIALVAACFEQGAIYPSPCDPSPFHGFPAGLNLTSVVIDTETGLANVDISDPAIMQTVINESREIIAAKGLTGRFGTWPAPAAMSGTYAFVEYAIKWIDGEINDKNDFKVLEECFKEFTNVNTYFMLLEEGSTTYKNYLLLSMDYIKY